MQISMQIPAHVNRSWNQTASGRARRVRGDRHRVLPAASRNETQRGPAEKLASKTKSCDRLPRRAAAAAAPGAPPEGAEPGRAGTEAAPGAPRDLEGQARRVGSAGNQVQHALCSAHPVCSPKRMLEESDGSGGNMIGKAAIKKRRE
ncbi:uncharacterized protein LOC144295827 [Canis aureus]